MRIATLALIGVALMGTGQMARADCAREGWIGTADDTRVPTHGSLYVHDELVGLLGGGEAEDVGLVELAWDAAGEPTGTTRVSRVANGVLRIDYAGPAGATLTVHRKYGWEDDTHVLLTEDWAAPEVAPRVLQFWHHVHEWTCSYSNSLMIQIDQPTAAIRAHWTIHGRAVDYIEPVRTDRTKAVLELGKINCGRENFPVEQLQSGEGELELFAIRFDGTEVPIRKAPRRIRLDKLPASELGIDAAFTIVDARDRDTSKPRVSVPAEDGTLGLIVLVSSTIGVLVGFVLLRRVERSETDCSPASE